MLDFGGNVGNILRDPESTIDEDRYSCIDVVVDSVEQGKAAWPKAQWHHYDRYCFAFNPSGVPRLPLPNLGRNFDYIVAYSVFTNTDRTDMLQLVGELRERLEYGGALAFTYIDPNHHSFPGNYDGNNFQWRLAREGNDLSTRDSHEKVTQAFDSRWCMLVNGTDLYVESEDLPRYSEQRSCHVFYSTDYMRSLFPTATIRPPANGEMQHCCVIRKE